MANIINYLPPSSTGAVLSAILPADQIRPFPIDRLIGTGNQFKMPERGQLWPLAVPKHA